MAEPPENAQASAQELTPEITLEVILGNRVTSSWSLRGWLAAAVTGAPLSCRVINMYAPGAKTELANASPSGLVPVVKTGGLVLWDSLAIIEYLNEAFPQAGFWPTDRQARAVARCVSAEMHSGFTALRKEMPMNLRRQGRAIEISEACRADIARICDIWTNCRMRFGAPSGAGPYLFGAYCAADIMFAPVVTRLLSYGVALEEIQQNYCAAAMRHPLMVEWSQEAAREEHETPYDAL